MVRTKRRKYEKADEVLRGIIANGRDVRPDGTQLQPSVIKQFDPAFDEVPSSTWRKKVSDMRTMFGRKAAGAPAKVADPSALQAPVAADGLNRMCTPTAPPEVASSGLDTARAVHNSADVGSESASESENDSDMSTFRPIYVVGEWEDDAEDKRVSVAILMPSGLCARKKDHDIRVVRGGHELEVSVVWPQAMTDMLYLHRSWLSTDSNFLSNHPRLISFRAFLRRLRDSNDQKIVSTFRLKLPFKVKSELSVTKKNTSYLSWKDSSEIVLYITLEAPDANYLAEKEEIPMFREA